MNEIPAPPDPLALLRQLDRQRSWHSLEDKRLCVLCQRVLTGRQVLLVINDDGQATARCPSDGCDGTPETFFYYASACAADPREVSGTSEFSFL